MACDSRYGLWLSWPVTTWLGGRYESPFFMGAPSGLDLRFTPADSEDDDNETLFIETFNRLTHFRNEQWMIKTDNILYKSIYHKTPCIINTKKYEKCRGS